MTFIKVNSIMQESGAKDYISFDKEMILNANSIECCNGTNISIVEGMWNGSIIFDILKNRVGEDNMGRNATEIILKNGKSIFVVEKLDYIYEQINK